MTAELLLVEPVPVPEIYIDGIARIEKVGGMLKLVFYSLQRQAGGACHEYEAVIVARVTMLPERVGAAAIQAMAAAETMVSMEPTH